MNLELPMINTALIQQWADPGPTPAIVERFIAGARSLAGDRRAPA